MSEPNFPWRIVGGVAHIAVDDRTTRCRLPANRSHRPVDGSESEACPICLDSFAPAAVVQIKVGSGSESGAVAHAVVRSVLEQRRTGSAIGVDVRAIAPASVNVAVKSIIIASGLLLVKGVDIVVRPHFEDAPGNTGGVVTVIVLRLVER